MRGFGDIAFTPAVRAAQAARGSRMAEHYDARPAPEGLGPDEAAFLESRSSVYLATVGEGGWPYVQHRGGPAGFLRVLDPGTLACADYPGNRQYVSLGNLAGEDRMSIFAMDYPRRGRLKLYGRATMRDAAEDPALAARLAAPGAPPAERILTVRVEAFDWNCPKYITPRYDEAEIEAMLGPRIAALTAERDRLAARVAELEGRG